MSAAPNGAGAALLAPGRNCRRVAEATRAAVIVDADDYFAHARAAMLRARRRIMLVGWDFDARITLGRNGAADEAPEKLGEFVLWLVERSPELEIFVLRWDVGALKTLLHGSTLFTVARWLRHPRIHAKLDGHHPTGASHHQKIAVIDDRLAFCGGIDMTGDRWDTREHRHGDERRRQPNGQPYKPWHDATSAIEGPMAEAIAAIARERWQAAGAPALEPLDAPQSAWPPDLVPHFENVPMGVSRSLPVMADQDEVVEIERLYLDLIAGAKRFVYAESQYFASRRIAEAIASRLDEPGGPEIVLVNPVTAQGWLEPVAMDTARARLFRALARRDPDGRRFRIYHPHTAGGEPIYVHAKILIADDRALRIGSSNMNNRSLRLDTECDVTLDAALCGDRAGAVAATIAAIRDDLLAEHLGTDAEAVRRAIAAQDSLVGAIESLRGAAAKTLRPYAPPELNAAEKWLADNEVLDPEGPDEMFEPFSKRGLFRRLRIPGRRNGVSRSPR